MHKIELTQEELDYIVFVIKGDYEILEQEDADNEIPNAEKLLDMLGPLSTIRPDQEEL